MATARHCRSGDFSSGSECDSLGEATGATGGFDQSSRMLAEQDFCHASQQKGESVADFIRRLKQLFKLMYGRNGMSKETRGILLHGQLQEGLCYDIMKAPAVAWSHGYKGLRHYVCVPQRLQAGTGNHCITSL